MKIEKYMISLNVHAIGGGLIPSSKYKNNHSKHISKSKEKEKMEK